MPSLKMWPTSMRGRFSAAGPTAHGGSPARTRRKSPNFVTARSRADVHMAQVDAVLLFALVVPLPMRRMAWSAKPRERAWVLDRAFTAPRLPGFAPITGLISVRRRRTEQLEAQRAEFRLLQIVAAAQGSRGRASVADVDERLELLVRATLYGAAAKRNDRDHARRREAPRRARGRGVAQILRARARWWPSRFGA